MRDENALQAALAELPAGKQSFFARLPGTHFGRCVAIPGPQLLFSTTHDRRKGYLELIADRIPKEADAIWGPCVGYPGLADRAAFTRYLEDHSVRTDLFVSAYPDATLPEVLRGLELRELLGDFAPRAQTMSPQELQAEYRRSGLA